MSANTIHHYHSLEALRRDVIGCHRCPRLVKYREEVPPKAPFKNEEYWRKPVPGFGDPEAWLMITGLAPAAHGGNRTGRPFTGDASGRFLFRGLYDAGLANQPSSEYMDDGLQLHGCYLNAVVKCAPPHDKPAAIECKNCLPYYQNELRLLKNLTHVLVLGRIAFNGYRAAMGLSKLHFEHGARYELGELPTLFACYHTSPRNTNTGLLTKEMFASLLKSIHKDRRT